MKNCQKLPIILTAVVFSSCFSTISVRVHSFDMAKMRTTPEYELVRLEKELRAYNTLLDGDYFTQLKTQIYNLVRDSVLADQTISGEAKTRILTKTVPPQLDDEFDALKTKMVATRDALAAYIKSPIENLKKAYDTAYAAYALKIVAVESFFQRMASDINTDKDDAESWASAFTGRYQKVNKTKGVSTTFGTSIADDDMESFISKAPEKYWQRYKSAFYEAGTNLDKNGKPAYANVSRVTTFIGNSDIAIKMDGPANFVIKGVRLDADAAFRTSFKVLSQGIQYMTYAAGVPTPSASTSGGSASATAQIPEIQSLAKNKSQFESLDQMTQSYTTALLKIIEAQRPGLLSPDSNKRKVAIDAIKNAYTLYQSQLQVQPAASTQR